MTLPNHHHRQVLSLHNKKRQLLCDYGSLGGLSLQEDGSEVKFVAQKYHPQPGELKYGAHHPSLPLFPTPAEVDFPFRDRISYERLRQIRNKKSFIKKIIWQRTYFHRARAAWDEPSEDNVAARRLGKLLKDTKSKLEKAIDDDDVEAMVSIDLEMDGMPWIKPIVDLYKECGSIYNTPEANWSYAGGCLNSMSRGDNQILLHPSGKQWDQICLTAVCDDTNGFLEGKSVCNAKLPSPVFQLNSQLVNNEGFCAARLADSCSLFKIIDGDTESSALSLQQLDHQVIDEPSSVSLSPYIPGEAVIATNNGDAVLWMPNTQLQTVVRDNPPRFGCEEPWRQCQFGSHPRLITMADRSVVQIFDIRFSQSIGTDLFSLPNKVLHKVERVQLTGGFPHHPFYHLVVTDYSLILVDERFPDHPVLQWNHMLTFPQYLSTSVNPLVDNDDVILLASQYPPETFAFQCRLSCGEMPPVCVSVPWRISRMDDFSLFPELTREVISTVRKERFSSLGGVCLLNSNSKNGRFTAIQLDCHGDLFYQVYDKQSLSGEITQAAGPGSAGIQLSSQVVKRGKVWLKSLDEQGDKWFHEIRTDESDQVVDASAPFTVISDQKYAHVLCPLCMPVTSDTSGSLSAGGVTGLQGEVTGDEGDTCWMCGYKLSITRPLKLNEEKDRVISASNESSFDWDQVFPKSTPLLNCSLPISQIMKKDWRDETDVKELLEAHDKQITKRNEEIIKERKERLKASQTKSSTQNLLSELLQKVNKPTPTGTPSGQTPSGSQKNTPCQSPRTSSERTPPYSPFLSPSGPFSQPSTPTLPGFGSTPSRLNTSSNSIDGKRSDPQTPEQPKTIGNAFDFLTISSPSALKSPKREFFSPAKRRKKHVVGF